MGAGAGPDAARVVVVALGRADVTVVLAVALRVVAVVAGAALETVVEGWVAAVVAEVSAVSEELVVLLGGPATANWPPFRNDGGPLWVIL